MPKIRPFQAVRYDPNRVEERSVLAPPYDIVSTEERDRLARNPNNVVHLELPLDEDGVGSRYSVASRRLREWMESGVLLRDPKASVYPYQQTFRVGERKLLRTGFFALVELVPPGAAGRVFPHETTLRGPREDRQNLLASTAANLSPIFLLYGDSSGQSQGWLEGLSEKAPLGESITTWGTEEKLWRVSGEEATRIADSVSGEELVFADGHHRYESALHYHQEQTQRGDGDSSAYVLALLVAAQDPGLVVLPTHRVLAWKPDYDASRLLGVAGEFFEVETISAGESVEDLAIAAESWLVDQESRGKTGIAMKIPGSAGVLGIVPKLDRLESFSPPESELDPRILGLDVVLLQNLLDRGLGISASEITEAGLLRYTRDAEDAIGDAAQGNAAAFLVRATPVSKVSDLAVQGLRMPQKSTYFYPKVTSGWLFHVHKKKEEAWRDGNFDPAASRSG